MHNITTEKKQQEEVNNSIKNGWEETCQFTKCLLVIGGYEQEMREGGAGWNITWPEGVFSHVVHLVPYPAPDSPCAPLWLACEYRCSASLTLLELTVHKLHTALRWPGSCSAPQQTADLSGGLSSLRCLSVQNWVVSHSSAGLISAFSQKKIG